MKNIIISLFLVLTSGVTLATDLVELNQGSVITANDLNENMTKLREASLKNYIINGNLDFWQRKTTGSSSYVADRIYCGGDCSQVSSTIPKTKYLINTTNYIEQRLESNYILELEGETVTLSFYSSNPTPQVYINNPSGVDEGYNTGSQSGVSASAISGKANYYSYTFTITETMADNGFGLRIIGAGSYGQIQLNKGSTPVEFRRSGKNYNEEQKLCERYYRPFIGGGSAMYTSIIGNALNGTRLLASNASLTFDMRKNPTIVDKDGDDITGTNTVASRAQALNSTSGHGSITVVDVSATVSANASAVINIYATSGTFSTNAFYAINFDQLLYADAEIY